MNIQQGLVQMVWFLIENFGFWIISHFIPKNTYKIGTIYSFIFVKNIRRVFGLFNKCVWYNKKTFSIFLFIGYLNVNLQDINDGINKN